MRLRPRNTIRLRLTVLYASLFLGSGAGLVAIIYALVNNSSGPLQSTTYLTTGAGTAGQPAGQLAGQPAGRPAAPLSAAQAAESHAAEMHQLLVNSEIALALMVAISAFLGWVVAGRVLSPLRTITGSVREITANKLDERLAVTGPRDDELAELSVTFNGLLDRLEAAFTAERLFVANASHELRTPLTRERTVMEVALRDKNATIESLRAAGERVLASGEQLEKLIEALLTLARSQRGIDQQAQLDLRDAADKALTAAAPAAREAGLSVRTKLEHAPAVGDPRLAERLVANLVDNAVRHNVPNGDIEVTTGIRDGRSFIRVDNTGPRIPPSELERLTHPFQRLAPGRSARPGSGLGLSIVHAIAAAHGAQCLLTARPDGGLTVEVRLPAAV